jgi:hypothetical protein
MAAARAMGSLSILNRAELLAVGAHAHDDRAAAVQVDADVL